MKKKINKKRKIFWIILIASILVITLISTIIIQNVMIDSKLEKNEYLALENTNSNLLASYIKKGVKIGGIVGTMEILDTSDATATPEDIMEGKTAYVNGVKITGTYKSRIDEVEGVTIPKGFYYVGGTKNDGIVISDNQADENKYSNQADIPADGLVGNQFVWVPVDDPSTMFTEGTATLTGVTTTTNIYSKLRVRSGDSYSAGAPGTSGIREPDILSLYDTDLPYYRDILGFANTKAMADSMVAEYKAMSDSIKKYHGFWIGRYELTGTVENPTVKAGDVLTNLSSEAENWYGLYKACQNVIKNNTDVKSTMIYGCQWDETMSWLSRNGYNTDTDSSSWGNYNSSPINTGSDTKYKANEIFDLAGNYYDWTQEAYYTYTRVVRGGYCDSSGSVYPASDRYDNIAGFSYGNSSSRAVLYIL